MAGVKDVHPVQCLCLNKAESIYGIPIYLLFPLHNDKKYCENLGIYIEYAARIFDKPVEKDNRVI